MSEDFHVKGRVSLDGSSLSRAGESIKRGLGQSFGQVASSFRASLLSVFSAGAMTALVGNSLRKALETSTEAAKTGVSTEEYATLQRLAEQTGVTVDEIAKKYIKAKETGGAFADTVQKAMAELLNDGLIPTTNQTQAMADAMLKLSDFAAKAAVAVGDVVANASKTAEEGGGGVFGWLLGSAKKTGQIMLGWTQEKIANAIEFVGGEASKLREDGLRNKLKGYGVDPDAPSKPKAAEKPMTAFGTARAEIAADAAAKLRKEAFSSGEKSQAMSVSALTQIGGYQTRGQSLASAQEYQLKLLNRQVGDLVALTKKGLQ